MGENVYICTIVDTLDQFCSVCETGSGYRLTITNTVVMTSDAVITGWTAVCTDALLAHTGPRKEQEEVGLTRDASVNGRARSATGWAKLSIC